MSTMVNPEGLAKGMAGYGPKKTALENIVASCKWCFCTKDMHTKGGRCQFCDQCKGFDTGTPTDGKPDTTSKGGPQKYK